MKRKEASKVHEFAKEVKILENQIDALQSIVRGITSRKKKGAKFFRVNIRRAKDTYGSYDSGVSTTLPDYVISRAFLPALREELKGLRDKLKNIPMIELPKKAV